MELHILYYILGIAGAIIILLLGVIGFFLKMIVKVINSLEETVNRLIKTVAIIETTQQLNGSGCTEKHSAITTRLNDHSKRLNEHGEEIAKLKAISPIHKSTEN